MAAAQRIGGIAVSIVADTARFQKGMSKSRAMLAAFARQARYAAAAAGTALVAGLTKAVMSVESLNRSMTRSTAIMGDVSKAMRGDMRQAAIDVAKVTNFSASQAADAYFYLASAGLDARQSLAALPSVAQFAQAGNFDLALATDLLTDAQSALGMSSKDAGKNLMEMTRLSDVLVKANTLANASVEQFSKALTSKAGAALRLLGKDVEEGVAVLAAYADQGLKAEEAGTAFSIVLRDMQTKALQNAEIFKRLNIAVFDSVGEMRNIADIIADVENALDGMSDAQTKATLLSLGFSDKSVAYTQALLGMSDKIREYEKALRMAGGTTRDVAEKSMTPLERATNKLKGAFAQFAESLAPVVDGLAAVISKVAELTEKLDGAKGSSLFKLLKLAVMGPGGLDPSDLTAALRPGVTPSIKFKKPPAPPAAAKATTPAADAAEAATKRGGSAFSGLGGKIGSALRDSSTARTIGQVGGAIAAAALNARDRAVRGYAGLPFALGRKIAMDNKRGIESPRSLAFAESGSAASYRQQAAIRRQNEGMKLDKKRNTLLEEIRDGVKNQPQLAMAGAG